jgi:hypothetical protein
MAVRTSIEIGLSAVIVAVDGTTPKIFAVRQPGGDGEDVEGLPLGPFDPLRHRTLEIGLRSFVEEQTGLSLGYVEQLYTFGDRGRQAQRGDADHVASVGYLALTRMADGDDAPAGTGGRWRPWYDFFPWEDFREDRPPLLDDVILPALRAWSTADPLAAPPGRALGRRERLRLAFGTGDVPWDEERVLDRYELLYEAGLVVEAQRDGRVPANAALPVLGTPMRHDHRRILATAISRLRSKLKYRPVVFELLPPEFTLTELQQTVEAIAGRHVHKQNFRRVVDAGGLVEPTGTTSVATGGRPAARFRFRRNVLLERPGAGVRLGSRT